MTESQLSLLSKLPRIPEEPLSAADVEVYRFCGPAHLWMTGLDPALPQDHVCV